MAMRAYAAGGLLALLAMGVASAAAAIQPCPADRNCAELAIEAPSHPAQPGDAVLIRVVFQQGGDDQQPGGVDDIAALTATVSVPGLALADCSSPGSDGLNPSFVPLPGDTGRYRAFVQNLTCASRASCLCPDGDQARDEYVNLLLVGTPGAGGVPALPNGELLGIALRVPPAAGQQVVALHVYSALDAPTADRPPGVAGLSIADGDATELTVDAAGQTMNIRVTDGALTIGAPPTPVVTNSPGATATATVTELPTSAPTGTATATFTVAPPPATATATTVALPCIGDCDQSHDITVNELIAGVGIVLGSLPASSCPAFECAGGQVDVSCLIAGVDAALNGCPAQ